MRVSCMNFVITIFDIRVSVHFKMVSIALKMYTLSFPRGFFENIKKRHFIITSTDTSGSRFLTR